MSFRYYKGEGFCSCVTDRQLIKTVHFSYNYTCVIVKCAAISNRSSGIGNVYVPVGDGQMFVGQTVSSYICSGVIITDVCGTDRK